MENNKWLIEAQSDGENEAFRILETANGKAELKYIAMDEIAANNLVVALKWMDSFNSGLISVPAPSKKSVRKPKPKTMVFELELEEPKKPTRGRKPKT